MTIKFYGKSNPNYSFLSNFHTAIFELQGHQWASVEHFYQAMKSTDPEVQAEIRATPLASFAKKLGQVCKVRDDWEHPVGTEHMHALFTDQHGIVVHTVKDHFMFQGLTAKFTQRKELRDALLLTGDHELVEDSPTDTYWGIGKDGTGQNKLGRMLQLVRSRLPNHIPISTGA